MSTRLNRIPMIHPLSTNRSQGRYNEGHGMRHPSFATDRDATQPTSLGSRGAGRVGHRTGHVYAEPSRWPTSAPSDSRSPPRPCYSPPPCDLAHQREKDTEALEPESDDSLQFVKIPEIGFGPGEHKTPRCDVDAGDYPARPSAKRGAIDSICSMTSLIAARRLSGG